MAQFFPDLSIFKGEWADNVLWIEIVPKKIANQKIQTATTIQLEPAPGTETYNFLAPEEMQENINHTWEPLENIMSNFSQKLASTATIFEQGTEAYKVDTPLLYKDSNRREITFLFNLSATGSQGSSKPDPELQVVRPVKNLMKWSSANLNKAITSEKIELPFAFQIRTKRGTGADYKDIINIKAAALTSVQPSYSQPYIKGFPSKCELTLTFSDIEPLSRHKSFRRNITVG